MEAIMITETNTELLTEVREQFAMHFGTDALIVRSPGRINLIGEHTDYNNGFVLPAAIDKYIYAGISERTDDEIHLVAGNLHKKHATTLFDLKVEKEGWSRYILGVVQQLQLAGYPMLGFNLYVTGNIPIGAGMSSSAAVECAVIYALNELFNFKLSPLQMIKLAKKAENEFVGVQCGIMDMFTSMMGRKNMAIQLDCRSLHYEYFPLELARYKIVLFDTQVKHSLASGEYNLRRQQCEEGIAIIQKIYPEVKSLRDVGLNMLQQNLLPYSSETVYKRCRYVVEENLRLLSGTLLLNRHDLVGFGKKMFATHKGLKNMYDVSCNELDLLVEMAVNEPAIIGARMMGGGFGGCTINLIHEDNVEDIFERFRKVYHIKTGLELKMYVTTTQDGTQRLL